MRRALPCILCLALAGSARADITAVLPAAADNTLFEDPAGSISDGAGKYFFVGQTAFGARRRALIRFDIAADIPAGSTITSAVLTMHMSRGGSSPTPVALHRAAADWGEAGSRGSGEEGAGAPAEPGDATWLHRFFPTALWANPGGDFSPVESTATLVAGPDAFYSWPSTPQMVVDLQNMLDHPALNFGWALLGDELSVPPTAKRFDSRTNGVEENHPALTITYIIPAPGAAWSVALLAIGAAHRRRRLSYPSRAMA